MPQQTAVSSCKYFRNSAATNSTVGSACKFLGTVPQPTAGLACKFFGIRQKINIHQCKNIL